MDPKAFLLQKFNAIARERVSSKSLSKCVLQNLHSVVILRVPYITRNTFSAG